jgi:hypothetical protein
LAATLAAHIEAVGLVTDGPPGPRPRHRHDGGDILRLLRCVPTTTPTPPPTAEVGWSP